MNDSILTIAEVAQLLKVADKTIYALAQRREIPAFKVGGQWRFSSDALQEWIAERSRQSVHARGASKAGSDGQSDRRRRRRR